MSDLQKELEPFPDEAGLSFVGSVDDGGFPQVKAMLAPRGREGLRVFWFSTNASSMRVAQFRRNGAACLYFCDPRTFRGLLLTGTMEVLEDAASRRLVWREGDERYYPGGVDGPDCCALRFTARTGRYYCDFHSENFEIK
ncbi:MULTISPECIES: pyridoxamine 5'-phosphate oxidase family protein [Alistipes]|uniref:pyridoxamine 5'-phosphate oxidase family protein n=1 Tax=Alistipes TaxID=239759 RepID=UPI001B38E2C2|nr:MULTISPECIES: pyridoxamine 5'-phosphate oxidase family protein [Alistipes]MBQ4903682.1 pyridoxamine 5'-phosphate oxidase family protein [Alistipes sp. Marseille-P2263]MCI2257964.1 pyridoxamine 5'-phosphate oxidase family protein [Alistipes dispar]